MKKIVSLLLVLALMLACVPAVFAENPFRDVSAKAWYAEDVAYVYENGLFNGTTNTTFEPNSPMTRAMLVTVLHRVAGQPACMLTNAYSDVKQSAWYAQAVSWATEAGVVNGVGKGRFAPNDPVTREQMITVLLRFTKNTLYGDSYDFPASDMSDFADAGKISEYAREAMQWGVSMGLLNGSKEGKLLKLNPQSSATRAEIAAILNRYVAKLGVVLVPPQKGGLVGIAMPTKDLQRWKQDGTNMKERLVGLGYEVDLQFAAFDIPTQISQLENMIMEGCKVLVIAPIDGEALGSVLALAKEAGIPVIAYDRLIMNSTEVNYFITFDNYDVGVKQGQYIEKALNLPNANGKVYNIEFIAGDPGDGNARVYYDGAMSVLKKYLDSGVLKCCSGQVSFEDACTRGWATDKAQERFENILATWYWGNTLDAVLASNDSTAQGVTYALGSTYYNDVYPIITGQDCDIVSAQNLVFGKQAMSVFKDTRDIAAKTAEMVDAIMQGKEPPINDTTTYFNGAYVVPSYLCEARVCTRQNVWELLIDSGYYNPWEIGLYEPHQNQH